MSTSKNLDDAFEANGKKPLPVEFDAKVKTYKPVGRNGAMFTRFIGNMIGHGIPLNHRSWNEVSSEFRPFILRRLREYFILDPTTPDWPMILAGIERECQDLYKNRKGKLKKHFENVGGYDNVAKARRNPPVHLGREEWDEIVNLFCDSKFKTRSATNAQNRTRVKYSSLHGSISYIASRYKQRNPETKELQGAIDNFRDMHQRPNGGWVNDLARIDHEAMLAEQDAQMQQDGSTSSSINDEAIITKVLGERRGHSRGIGRKLKGSALSSFLDPLPPPSQLPTVDMMKNVAEAINATNQHPVPATTHYRHTNSIWTATAAAAATTTAEAATTTVATAATTAGA